MSRPNLLLLLAVLFCAAALPSRAQNDNSLLAYLPMREDLTDHSTRNNPVTVNGNIILRDRAAFFSGKGTSLELPHFDFANHPFAVTMWIKVTGKNPMYGLLQQEDSSDYNHWLHLMLRGGRQPYLGFMINDAISPQDIPLREWTHLGFVYTGTRQELWVNGRLLCARTAPAYEGTSGLTLIGSSPRWDNVPSKDFEGCMRELRIYNRALTATELAGIYNLENDSPNPVKAFASNSTNPNLPLSDALAAQVGIPFLDIQGRKLVITGESRQIYEVQATSDIGQPWQPLTTLTNQSGVVEFEDTGAPNVAQRFYRVKTK